MNACMKTKTEVWKESLLALDDYISHQSDISISSNMVSVPRELRAEFYHHFDSVLELFVEAYTTCFAQDMSELSECYRAEQSRFIELTNVRGIALPKSLETYLENPLKALAGGLYLILFDYLQGKTTCKEFEKVAFEHVVECERSLQRCGFEFWVFLRVLNLLNPRKVYGVIFGPNLQPQVEDTIVFEPGKQQPLAERRIPDTVIETQEGVFYALKFENSPEIGYYDMPIVRRRDNTLAGNSKEIIGQRVMIVYRISDLESIPTVANRDEACVVSPDIVIEISSKEELSVRASRLALGNRALTLHPNMSYCVIVPEDCEASQYFEKDRQEVEAMPNLSFYRLSHQDKRLSNLVHALRES